MEYPWLFEMQAIVLRADYEQRATWHRTTWTLKRSRHHPFSLACPPPCLVQHCRPGTELPSLMERQGVLVGCCARFFVQGFGGRDHRKRVCCTIPWPAAGYLLWYSGKYHTPPGRSCWLLRCREPMPARYWTGGRMLRSLSPVGF